MYKHFLAQERGQCTGKGKDSGSYQRLCRTRCILLPVCAVDWLAGCWSRKDLKAMALIYNGPAQTLTKKEVVPRSLARLPDPFLCSMCDTLCWLLSELVDVLQHMTHRWLCSNAWADCSLLPQENIWFAFWWGNQGRYWCSQHLAGSQQPTNLSSFFYTALTGPEWKHLQSSINFSGTMCWRNQPLGKPDAFLRQCWGNWGWEGTDWQAAKAFKEMQPLQETEQEMECLGGRNIGEQND